MRRIALLLLACAVLAAGCTTSAPQPGGGTGAGATTGDLAHSPERRPVTVALYDPGSSPGFPTAASSPGSSWSRRPCASTGRAT